MSIKISKNRLDMGSTPIKNVSYQDLDQVATQAAPAASKTRLYSKTDGGLYVVPAGGSETSLNSAAHIAASAAVHGLPASVNVLGDRAAAGEFVQRGTAAISSTEASWTAVYRQYADVTFAVAFSATPFVHANGFTTDADVWTTASNVSTTGFRARSFGGGAGSGAVTATWVALGS